MRRRCRILVDVDGELVGPFCRIRDAKAAVECGRKIRLVPADLEGCDRAWDVTCGREVIGEACELPRRRRRRDRRK